MRAVALAALAAVVFAGCATVSPSTPATASAELRDAAGRVVGTASLSELSGGVRIVLEARGLPPGEKGVHVHEIGKCEAPGFMSAGSHFNPARRQHGILNPQGPHNGDLPNITVGADGSGRLETTTDRITLGAGESSVLDADGSALVIHVAPDDFRTDPTGNSGARLACGVIEKRERGEAARPPAPRGGY